MECITGIDHTCIPGKTSKDEPGKTVGKSGIAGMLNDLTISRVPARNSINIFETKTMPNALSLSKEELV